MKAELVLLVILKNFGVVKKKGYGRSKTKARAIRDCPDHVIINNIYNFIRKIVFGLTSTI